MLSLILREESIIIRMYFNVEKLVLKNTTFVALLYFLALFLN